MLSDYHWRSRWIYGVGADAVDWTMALPVRPWNRTTRTTGGSRTAAGGTPASHVVRRDYLLNLTLRYLETEVESLAGLIQWGQSAEAMLWYPDAAETDSFPVWLEHPVAGEDLAETRLEEYPRVLEATLVLRRTVPFPWTLDFYPEP